MYLKPRKKAGQVSAQWKIKAEIPLPGHGPEDVLLDDEGNIYCGLENGTIIFISHSRDKINILGNTQGRPLGLDWLSENRLLICDGVLGILCMDTVTGTITTLCNEIEGVSLGLCNNPCVAKDGTIYFTESSTRHSLANIKRDIIENIPTGRLIALDRNGVPKILLDKLYCANGVTLDKEEKFILVVETGARRIMKLWLKGKNQGACETFADNLPGYPDNISTSKDGSFWLALPTPTDERLSTIHKLPLILRTLVAKMPDSLKPAEKQETLLLKISESGDYEIIIQETTNYPYVTGVREYCGDIYTASITLGSICIFHNEDKSNINMYG